MRIRMGVLNRRGLEADQGAETSWRVHRCAFHPCWQVCCSSSPRRAGPGAGRRGPLHAGDDDRGGRGRSPPRRSAMAAPTASSAPTRRRRIADGPQHPLVIALHGGSGNASQMMADDHGIIARPRPRATSRCSRTACRAPAARRAALPRQQLGAAGQRLLRRRADRPADGDRAGRRRPHPSGRLLRRREADLRHRRHARLSARDQLGRDRRRRVRPLPCRARLPTASW